MPGSDDAHTTAGHRTGSTFYRRPPGAAWIVALVAIPLLLAAIGWSVLNKSDEDVDASLPSVNPSATLTAPSASAPNADAPDFTLSPLSILRNGRGFTLAGELPDVATKNSLMESLRLAFGPGITFTDNVNIKAGANPPDFAALGSIMGSAMGIPDFHFDLNGDTITLDGTAPSDKDKADAEAAAKAAWPKLKVVNNIEAKAPAPQAPSAPVQSAAPAPQAGPSPAPAGGACATLQADITALLKTPINFQTDGFTLTPGSQQQLIQIADKLKACPDPKVSVVGHADDSGNDAINIPLSNSRAKAVADYLVSQGVVGDRVTSMGVGSAEPIAPNDTPAGKAQNRRVDITVS